jgi:hypothetical protein
MMPNSIQSGEHSTDGARDGVPHNSDGNPNVLYSNRNDDGQWVNANWDNPDNQWNDNGASAFPLSAILFISPSPWRGSFVSPTVPDLKNPCKGFETAIDK